MGESARLSTADCYRMYGMWERNKSWILYESSCSDDMLRMQRSNQVCKKTAKREK